MAVPTKRWLIARTGMIIKRVSDINSAVCIFLRGRNHVIVLFEYRMTRNYRKHYLDRLQ